MLKNYFSILGLEYGASDADVRKAYRTLAKQFHPDINNAESARERFIEINLAYEFLTDNAQRSNYERLNEDRIDREEQERRERIYKLWVDHQQRQARYRSAVHSAYASRGKKVPYSKLYGRANFLVNVIFLLMFAGITAIPVWRYFAQIDLPEEQQRSIVFFIMPATLGVIFIVVGYYYWFVVKTDRHS